MELEIRYSMNGLVSAGRVVRGVVMQYGAIGKHPGGFRERIEPGAFTFEPGLFLNRFHQRITPIARLGKHLTLEDTNSELRMTATLPETATCNDVLKEIDAELLNGFSVEMKVARDSWQRGVRVIHKAKVYGIGLVDKPAYPEATLRWFTEEAAKKRSINDGVRLPASILAARRVRAW